MPWGALKIQFLSGCHHLKSTTIAKKSTQINGNEYQTSGLGLNSYYVRILQALNFSDSVIDFLSYKLPGNF